MKKFIPLIFLLTFFSYNSIFAQCSNANSPEPNCISTLSNGDIEVNFDIGNWPNAPMPFEIDYFELYASANGSSFATSPTVSIPVGVTWPTPTFTHVGASGFTQDWWYKIVAVCSNLPSTLPQSSIIRSIRLKSTVMNTNEVHLKWNWDSISSNTDSVFINRKLPHSSANWEVIAKTTLQTQSMSYVDTVSTNLDTIAYQIVVANQTSYCLSYSSEELVLVNKYASIEEKNQRENNNLILFPNPTSGQFTFKLERYKEGELLIYNSMGALVFSQSYLAKGHVTSDFPNSLKDGLYFVKFVTEDEILSNKLIVKRE